MPPFTVPMNPLCDVTFVAQMKKLPLDWKQPQGGGEPDEAQQYSQSMQETNASVSVPEPMCYFWAQSVTKYHTDTCKEIGGNFKDFAHKMLDAIKFAHDMWRPLAKFKDLKVNSLTALGTPGCLDSQTLESNIKNAPTTAAMGINKDFEKDWRDAIAKGVSDCFDEWRSKVMIPGLPFYPAFIVYPGPMAPPTPNIPFPLIAMPSAGLAKMTPTMLKNAMCDAFSVEDDPDDQFGALAMSIGTALSAAFLAWLPMQMAMNILGKGPVPSFAPPYVPVGPVVMGDNLPIPGHLAA